MTKGKSNFYLFGAGWEGAGEWLQQKKKCREIKDISTFLMRLCGHVVKVRINTESFVLILTNFASLSCVSGDTMTTEIVHPIHTFSTIFTWLSSTVINIYDRKEIVLFSINTSLNVLKWKPGTTRVRCCSV